MMNSARATLIFLSLAFYSFSLCSPAYAKLETFQAADVVVGQPNFTSGTADNGGISARTLDYSTGFGGETFSDGKRLFVVDASNHRFLIWNSIPTTNFAPADVVLGQPNFTSSTSNNGGISARTLNFNFGAGGEPFSDGKKLFIADHGNHRILIWNSIPTTNFASADGVLGQPNFTSATANNGGISARTLSSSNGVSSDGKRLFVVDNANNRILIWNSIPTTNFASADVVLGQPNFTSATANNGGRGARTLSGPRGVFSDGKRLFVVDTTNNRILIWNSIPTTNFASADVVLGQPGFTFATANNGGRSARSLNTPDGGLSNGKRLFIVDRTNHRVLIWNSIPTENFTPADAVLGQPDFVSGTANNGGRGAQTLSSPVGVFFDGKRLFVIDEGNNRVLIFNTASLNLPLGPQFEQGKAVLGKVFNDQNQNGIQDTFTRVAEDGTSVTLHEKGISGVKVVSDTGIYAITDEDGKYHFPFIETGQRLLKLDPTTLPEGARITTKSPRKVIVTKGILTKVSFGVRLPQSVMLSEAKHLRDPSATSQSQDDALLKVSISQDPMLLKPELGVQAKKEKDEILFTIHCNYFLLIQKAHLSFYDEDLKPIKTIPLPMPLPYTFPLSFKEFPEASLFHYQLSVFDREGREDRTGLGTFELIQG